MTTTREARHLSGADLGKNIEFKKGDATLNGILAEVHPQAQLIDDTCIADAVAGRTTYTLGQRFVGIIMLIDGEPTGTSLTMSHPVTITGTNTPPGLNLHRPVADQEG
ncbi:hypothetical protein ACNPON_18630 [Glutamicibacter sp. AGC13]